MLRSRPMIVLASAIMLTGTLCLSSHPKGQRATDKVLLGSKNDNIFVPNGKRMRVCASENGKTANGGQQK